MFVCECDGVWVWWCVCNGDGVSSDGVRGDDVTKTLWFFSLQDLSNLYDQYRSIQPWLQRKEETQSDKELYQSVEDRKKLVSHILHLLHLVLVGRKTSKNMYQPVSYHTSWDTMGKPCSCLKNPYFLLQAENPYQVLQVHKRCIWTHNLLPSALLFRLCTSNKPWEVFWLLWWYFSLANLL